VSPTKIEDDVAAIAKRWKTKRGSLIMALHALQDRYGYVPRDAAMSLGAQIDVPLARIYEVLSPTALRTNFAPSGPPAYTRMIRLACGAARTTTRISSSCTRSSWARRWARSPSSCCTRATITGPNTSANRRAAADAKSPPAHPK